MDFKNKIDNQIKESMLKKNKDRLVALRAIKSAILLEEKSGIEESINEIKILSKLIKQRKDSSELYKKQNRMDLYKKEEDEIKIIQEFLPDQLSEEDLNKEVDIIINESGAKTIQEMGKVMGIASKRLEGKADNSTIASLIKQKLS